MDHPPDSAPDIASMCYEVRKSYFPQKAYITIGVLSAFVVMINSLAMLSVLKNYRRLRQRIYVFVISLAAVEILAGIVFLSDVLSRFLEKQHESESPKGDDVIYSTMTNEGEKFIRLRADDSDSISRELLEGLKASVVLLSVLNIALVTFALYKRTTSMGRHHEDFKHVSAGLMSDAHSFLPAFDTMMRVLSVGGPAYTYGVQGQASGRGSRSSATKNGESSPMRRYSSGSKTSNSSPQRSDLEQNSSFSKEPGSGTLENGRDPGLRKNPPIVRMSIDSKGRKPSGQGKSEMSKRSAGMTRLMSTGRRVSQAIRSRSTSGTQAYVGRHSYSVMSKPATTCSLLWIWLLFAITCLVPVVLRRTSIDSIVCPEACRSVELSEITKTGGSQLRGIDDNAITGYVATTLSHRTEETVIPDDVNVAREVIPEPIMDLMTTTVLIQSGKRKDENVIETYSGKRFEPDLSNITTPVMERLKLEFEFDPPKERKKGKAEKGENLTADNLILETNILHPSISDAGDCIPVGYRRYRPNTSAINPLPMFANPPSEKLPDDYSYSEGESENKRASACASCSSAFYPLSKSHTMFTAVVVVITWFWLLISASRLYYLRKHSTNVFVRCSALWRFMFMTAVFYFFTLAPYVVWIVLDFVMPSPSTFSPLWKNDPLVAQSQYGAAGPKGGLYNSDAGNPTDTSPPQSSDGFTFRSRDLDQFYTIYGVVVTCCLLLNFAIAPTLYLVRLLGFRRIISAL